MMPLLSAKRAAIAAALALVAAATACSQSPADSMAAGNASSAAPRPADPAAANVIKPVARTAPSEPPARALPPPPAPANAMARASNASIAQGMNMTNAASLPTNVTALPPLKPMIPQDLPLSNDMPAFRPFPREVTQFMVARDGCDHFRGEDPYDADRRAFLAENIRELCTGTDERLATLRERYADDPDVIAALSGYDDRIETAQDQ